jgi:hypothetical protein
MGLLSKTLAVGVGYVLAQPEVRKKIVAVVQHPKVKQRRDQARDLATTGLRTAQDQLRRSSATETEAHASAPAPPHTGVPSPSPSYRGANPAALREGVLPPAQDVGAPPTPKDS